MANPKFYCPFCHSQRAMMRAGIRYNRQGNTKQQYKCGVCHRVTVHPLKNKPRVRGNAR